jgi:hypothetical protein
VERKRAPRPKPSSWSRASTRRVRALFAEPFVANWTFDVELLARLVAAHRRGDAPDLREAVRELPLHQWHHVAGSKIRASDFLRALVEVRRIRARYLRSRAGSASASWARDTRPEGPRGSPLRSW